MTIHSDAMPATLSWAVRLLRGEGIALGLIALWLIYQNLTASVVDVPSALLITAFALGGAGVLWATGAALKLGSTPHCSDPWSTVRGAGRLRDCWEKPCATSSGWQLSP